VDIADGKDQPLVSPTVVGRIKFGSFVSADLELVILHYVYVAATHSLKHAHTM